jgi:MFS family permease
VVAYSAIFPFQTFAVKFFIEAHGTTREVGGFLSSILTLFAMIATPLFGYLTDRKGRRASRWRSARCCSFPHIIMAAFRHALSMAMMGVAFS